MERMFQKLFHIYFLIPCLMFLCVFFSRNNALTVYIAASVLMNYRSTVYGFRKSPLWLWISQLSLPRSLPRKEMRSLAVPFFTKGMLHTNCCTSARSPSFYLWGHDGLQGSAPELSSLIIDKGAQSQGRDVDTSFCFSGRAKAPLSTLGTLECIQRKAPEISSFRANQPKRNSFILQPTVHTHSSSSSRGRSKQLRESQF